MRSTVRFDLGGIRGHILPKWLVFSILTTVFFGAWAAVARQSVVASQSPYLTQVISTLGLLPVMVGLVLTKGVQSGGKSFVGISCAFASGLLTGVGNLGLFAAMQDGGSASEVVPLTSLYPVVTVILALIFLRERLHWAQWLGVLLATSAMYPLALYAYGRSAPSELTWTWLAMVPFVLWGVAALLQKLATNRISSEVSTLYFLVAFVPIAALLLTLKLNWNIPAQAWIYLVLSGLLLGLGNVTLLRAFGSGGKAAIVTPISGLYAIVTVPLAIVWLKEEVTAATWVGIILAVAAIVALSVEKKPERAA